MKSEEQHQRQVRAHRLGLQLLNNNTSLFVWTHNLQSSINNNISLIKYHGETKTRNQNTLKEEQNTKKNEKGKHKN